CGDISVIVSRLCCGSIISGPSPGWFRYGSFNPSRICAGVCWVMVMVFITFLVALLFATAIAWPAYLAWRKYEPTATWQTLVLICSLALLAIWIGGFFSVINHHYFNQQYLMMILV